MKILDRSNFLRDINMGWSMMLNTAGIEYISFSFGFSSRLNNIPRHVVVGLQEIEL